MKYTQKVRKIYRERKRVHSMWPKTVHRINKQNLNIKTLQIFYSIYNVVCFLFVFLLMIKIKCYQYINSNQLVPIYIQNSYIYNLSCFVFFTELMAILASRIRLQRLLEIYLSFLAPLGLITLFFFYRPQIIINHNGISFIPLITLLSLRTKLITDLNNRYKR